MGSWILLVAVAVTLAAMIAFGFIKWQVVHPPLSQRGAQANTGVLQAHLNTRLAAPPALPRALHPHPQRTWVRHIVQSASWSWSYAVHLLQPDGNGAGGTGVRHLPCR